MEFEVWGFGVWDLGFGTLSLGFGVQVWGLGTECGFRVQGSDLWVKGFRLRV
jgi:hypothetical protein